jgi:DNA-binding CsgD family transcriptional regulator
MEPFSIILQALASTGDSSKDSRSPRGRSTVEWLEVLTGAEDAPDAHKAFQRQMFAAAVNAVATMSEHGPLVLILEDLHWSGPAGQQLLTYLIKHTSSCRMLILATHRNTPPDRSAAFVETIASIQGADGVLRLDLGPLRSEHIAEFLRRDGGVSPESAASAAVSLRKQTGGNPYFVRELWRYLRSLGGIKAMSDVAAAPASVRDAFHGRLRRLGARATEIAGLAAVIGEEIEPAVLCESCDHPVAEVLSAVDACVDAGLMLPMNDSEDAFRFTHALARQSVLDLTPISVRMRFHARVARVIERRPATRRRIQRLAHHYASAHSLGYADKAVHYLLDAAANAVSSLAHRDAARLYERAAELITEPSKRDAVLLDAVQHHIYAGDFARARELVEQVATAGGSAQRLSAAIAFEAASWRPGLPGHRAVELLTAAIGRVAGELTDADAIRALAGLGRAYAFTSDRERASANLAKAIKLARATGDDVLLMEALSAGLWERRSPAYAITLRQRAVNLCDLARERGNLVLLGPAAHHRAMAGYVFGEPAELDAGYRELAGVAQSTGQAYFEYFAGGVAYGRQFITGDFLAAERTCAALVRLGLSFGTDDTNGPFGVQSFMVRRESGQLDQVRPLITGDEDPAAFWAPGLLALYTEFGMREPMTRVMRWILDRDVLRDEKSAQWPMVLAFLTEAALTLEDAAAAARLRPALEQFAGRNLVGEPFVALFGSADRYIGAVDSLLRQGDPDLTLAAALEMDTRMAAPVHVALTLASTIIHLRRARGTEAHVQTLLRQTHAIAGPLRLERVIRMVGHLPAVSRLGGLTAREVEVLRLVGAGLGNREIGKRLFITENTAANHVRSILAKTGAKNRTQAARYAIDHGLML